MRGRTVLLAVAMSLAAAAGGYAQSDSGVPAFATGPEIRAQMTPVHFTTLSSEISARIEHIATRIGERFAKGDTLIEFDCASEVAQLQGAVAEESQSRKKLTITQRLESLKSIGQLEVDAAEADVEKAAAQHAMAQAAVDKCTIVAPYGGVTVEQKAQEFQHANPGDPILDVVDESDLEIELIVPSRWLAWLKPGFEFAMHIDELDRPYQAHVIRLGGQVDPVSQSIKVIGKIDGDSSALLPGMSGSVQMAQPETAPSSN